MVRSLTEEYHAARVRYSHYLLFAKHGSKKNGKTSSNHVSSTPPASSFFNTQVGIEAPQLHTEYPLIVAERLLLFPDSMRHFHSVIGRDNVPCDFFADIDLPNETLERGEKLLLEVLNYLEVRLPGIGFTNPFFLILTNEPNEKNSHSRRESGGKVSYHLHVRSMTHLLCRFQVDTIEEVFQLLHKKTVKLLPGEYKGVGGESDSAEDPDTTANGKKTKGKRKGKAQRNAWDEKELEEEIGELLADEGDADEEDDLTDLVNAIEGEEGGEALGKDKNAKKKSKKNSSHNASAKEKEAQLRAAGKVIAFQDFRTVRLVAEEVNQTLNQTVIDMNCYRQHGMLRCAFNYKMPQGGAAAGEVDLDRYTHSSQNNSNKKSKNSGAASEETSSSSNNSNSRRLVPLVQSQSNNKELQLKLNEMSNALRHLSDPEILELSFGTRHVETDAVVLRRIQYYLKHHYRLKAPAGGSKRLKEQHLRLQQYLVNKHQYKLVRVRHVLGPQYAQPQEFDAYGNVVSPFLTEKAKWKRYKAVVEKLHRLPVNAAEGFDTWVRVGLALHNFSNEDHVFEEWVKFSLRCPMKFSREMCRKKWTQFERNPDALNWRRGFNYLNSTIWKQV